jgi:hypothetical protein
MGHTLEWMHYTSFYQLSKHGWFPKFVKFYYWHGLILLVHSPFLWDKFSHTFLGKIGIVLKKCRFKKIAKILPNFWNHQVEKKREKKPWVPWEKKIVHFKHLLYLETSTYSNTHSMKTKNLPPAFLHCESYWHLCGYNVNQLHRLLQHYFWHINEIRMQLYKLCGNSHR